MRVSDDVSVIGSGQLGLSSPFDCHVYAVCMHHGVVLIDAGSGLAEEAILRELNHDFPGRTVHAILLTHAHADHAAGAKSLASALRCDVIAGEQTKLILEAGDEERNGLARARKSGSYPVELQFRPTAIARALRDSESIEIDGLHFEAVHVRGHSDDSICYSVMLPSGPALFTGDVVFYGGLLGVINAQDSGMQGYCTDLHQLHGRNVSMLFPSHGLFTLRDGQRHIDHAISSCERGFLPWQIGQGDNIF